MDIKELKYKIEKGTLDDSFMVWIATEDNIVVDQYIKAIKESKHLETKFIDNLNEIPDESFIVDPNLYILKTKKWASEDKHDNCIVICEEAKSPEAIKFPNIESWQVIDYVAYLVPGIPDNFLETLIKQYTSNYARFISDMQKLSIFSEDEQLRMLEKTIQDGCYDELSSVTVFDLTTALIKKDMQKVTEVLKVKPYIDLTPMHFWTIITNNFKNIVRLQLDPSASAQSLGISDKQAWVIKKYNCGFYSKEQLIKIYKMLCSIENKFKFGELDVDNIIDYIVCKVLEVTYLC